jgi:hypothetical protein
MVLVLFTAGAAGCTRNAGPTVATAGPGGVQASAGADGERSAPRYSKCMREQGLTWFPDPDAQGGLTVHNPDGVDQREVERAEQACKAYAPWEGPKKAAPAADLERLRQVSRCMREHGVEKYPDPDAYGGVTIDSQAVGVDPDSETFRKARQECERYMPTPDGKVTP